MTQIKMAVGFIAYGPLATKYLEQFYPSLLKALAFSGVQFKIWCWDNLPADSKNADWLTARAPETTILSSGENLGFAQAANRLLAQAGEWGADYFLLVNPDTCWDEQAIKSLVQVLTTDERLGSVAPKILYWDFLVGRKTRRIDTLGIKKLSGLRFVDLGQGEIDRGRRDKAKILGPSGAAALYRLSALEAVKKDGQIFDEAFFMYKEDCDLAMRLKQAGWRTKLVPESRLWHDRSVKTKSNRLVGRLAARSGKSEQARRWSLENQLLIVKKYWRGESFFSKLKIGFGLIAKYIWTCLFERDLLPVWKKVWISQ